MAAATGGIDDPQVSGVLLGPWVEHLARVPDHVLTAVGERGPGVAHLVPDPAERVIGKKLDHVPRGEELVADGQLTAVPGRLAFAPHLAAFVGTVEVLIDP